MFSDPAQRSAEAHEDVIGACKEAAAQLVHVMARTEAAVTGLSAGPASDRSARELAIIGIRLSQILPALRDLAAAIARDERPPAPEPAPARAAAKHRARRPWLSAVPAVLVPVAAAAAAEAARTGRAAGLRALARHIARGHRLVTAGATVSLLTAGTIALTVVPAPFVSSAQVPHARAAVPAAAVSLSPAPAVTMPHDRHPRRHRRRQVPGSPAPVRTPSPPPKPVRSPAASPSPSAPAGLLAAPSVLPAGSTMQLTLTAAGGPVAWTSDIPGGISLSAWSGTVTPGHPVVITVTVTGPGAAIVHIVPGADPGTCTLLLSRA